MHINDDVLAKVDRHGFAYVDGWLTPSEVEAARAALFMLFPRLDRYHDRPRDYPQLSVGQFGGLRSYPFGIDSLDSLGTHPDLIHAAERYCATSALAQHSINIWAKYSGTVDYEQTLHRDYPEKSTVVPSFGKDHDQLTIFILLSDVGIDDGPTMFVTHDDASALGHAFPRSPGLLADREEPMIGSAGSAYLFDYTTVHRGSGFRGDNTGRFLFAVEYVRSERPWLARTRWHEKTSWPEWVLAVVSMTPRQRELFGFPADSDPFWTPATVRGLEKRYPGIDTSPYLARIDHVE